MGLKEKILSKSLYVFHLSSGSCNNCDIELIDCLTPRYDVERFGIVLVGSIKHADVLLCTGSSNRLAIPRIKKLYEQMPQPGYVIVWGACGSSRGLFKDSYNTGQPLDEIMPVDVYIPGCPPRPEAIIMGFEKLIEKIKIAQKLFGPSTKAQGRILSRVEGFGESDFLAGKRQDDNR